MSMGIWGMMPIVLLNFWLLVESPSGKCCRWDQPTLMDHRINVYPSMPATPS